MKTSLIYYIKYFIKYFTKMMRVNGAGRERTEWDADGMQMGWVKFSY